MFRINTLLYPKDEPISEAFHTFTTIMVSPNEKKKSSNSSPTTPATPATKQPSKSNIAGDQTPRENEVVVPATVPDASGAENDPYGHVMSKPNLTRLAQKPP